MNDSPLARRLAARAVLLAALLERSPHLEPLVQVTAPAGLLARARTIQLENRAGYWVRGE